SFSLPQWTGGSAAIDGIDQPWLPAWITGPWAGANSIGLIQNFTCRVSWSPGDFPCYAFSFDPIAFYVLIIILIIAAVILVTNLYSSRLGRAWMAVRDADAAAAAMGLNAMTTNLLAIASGASFSGSTRAYYGASIGVVH